ncbi:MAG TPA: TIGR00296 family protein [Nitrososphaerales archaeon]|nr:TIGR00296 family protein [Nitrososphaerales archaeon]
MSLSSSEGQAIVGLARSTLDKFVAGGKVERKSWDSGFLSEKRGVFTTLEALESGGKLLRGCIGYIEPVFPLGEAVQETAILAASQDPRFEPVRAAELDSIVVEVSALTVPEVVEVASRRELPKKVKVGRDGLIVSTPFQSGVLLPQVAVENGWDSEDFLSETCRKANLMPDSWLDAGTTVKSFQAEVFGEVAPRGEVKRLAD